MKEKLTAGEFRKMLDSGQIQVGKKGKLRIDEEEDYPDQDESINTEFDFNPGEYIFIPGRVYSSKNSTQIRIKPARKSKWKVKTKTKGWIYVTPFVAKNDNSEGYMKKKTPLYRRQKERFEEMMTNKAYPIMVEFILAMPTRGVFDYINILQLVQDTMVSAGLIPDDNSRYIMPVLPLPPKLAWFVDKKNPGIYFKIL